MRILQVIPYFYPAEVFGGPVRVAFDVGKELVKRGHEVVVFTSDAKDLENRLDVENDEIEGMRICYFRNLSMFFGKWSKLFITPGLPRKMEQEIRSFDIIHAHEYTTYQNIVVHRLAKKYGVPYVLQAHGSMPKVGRQARKWLYDVFFGSNLLRDASKVIALSRMEAERYRCVGVSDERISIIPNGIDLSDYTNLPSKGFFRKKFDIRDNKKIILYLGRVHKTKGIDLLVKSYACLVRDLKYANAMLVIAGPDDGYLTEAKSLADSSGISGSVLFTGFINDEDKLRALVDADVFVTPSFYGFPMTFLEACAVGTPIVTTTLGDTLEWIDDSVGYVKSPTQYDLAMAIYEILSDGELFERFSRNCRKVVTSEFSMENVVDKLEQLYGMQLQKD